MAGIGVDKAPALRVEYPVEAGDERVGWHVRVQNLVSLRQYLSRGDALSLGDSAQHTLSVGHHQGRRDTLAGDVADDETHTAVVEAEEVVEVAAHLSRGL